MLIIKAKLGTICALCHIISYNSSHLIKVLQHIVHIKGILGLYE